MKTSAVASIGLTRRLRISMTNYATLIKISFVDERSPMQNRFVDTATSRAWYASNTLARKLFLTVAILPLSISGTRADVKFIPHAEAGYEYNSNLFQVNEATPRVDPLGMPRLEDTSINYGGGVDLVGAWGENKLKINTAIVRSVYDHFNQLNRNDQLFGLGLDWTATSKIAGTLTARYDQHLTPFTDLADPTIAAVTFSQIDRVFGLAINLPASGWRLWKLDTRAKRFHGTALAGAMTCSKYPEKLASNTVAPAGWR